MTDDTSRFETDKEQPISVKLETFDGPLDLLLHLLAQNKVDIYDIPIFEITKQYLDYLQKWDELNMEVASEFIVMASTLISIKVRKLLPNALLVPEDVDEEALLTQRLALYQRYKTAGQNLKTHLPKPNQLLVWRDRIKLKGEKSTPSVQSLLAETSIEDLHALYLRLEAIKKESINPDKAPFKEVKKDRFSVRDKILYLKSVLLQAENLSFNSLRGESDDKEEVATYFLALLELSHGGFVSLDQKSMFGDITVSRLSSLENMKSDAVFGEGE